MTNQDENQPEPSKPDDEGQQSRDMPVKSKEDMQQRLGLGLKNMYLSVLDEPLPDDMLALLDQLDDDDDSDSSRPDINE
ncbi:NepR family anti-sigma factor [Parasphingorhabdus sp.]|uniref:NepR family anti-sigma factor n=1 Tax=Parasphingorhabdus sp. TaxID=2709688 RepID=UPI003A93F5C0